MRLPRDLTGDELVRKLEDLGYVVMRQTGSHIRLTHVGKERAHHLTVPRHKELKVGTLNRIVKDAARHFGLSPDELSERLWGS